MFQLEYTINGIKTACTFEMRQLGSNETAIAVHATIDGKEKEFLMRMHPGDTDCLFRFIDEDVPFALKEAEVEISDAVFEYDF